MSSRAVPPASPDNISAEHHLAAKTSEPSDIIEDSHDKPSEAGAGTMAEQKDHQKEDPATTAASEELRHTTISDNIVPSSEDHGTVSKSPPAEDKQMGGTQKGGTPEAEPTDAQDEAMRERLSSPKKKRGRDQEDDEEYSDDSKIDEVASADGATMNGSRTTRSEPEKKRHRDTSEDPSKASESVSDSKEMAIVDSQDTSKTSKPNEDAQKKSPELAPKPIFGSGFGGDKPQTSSSAFAASGFGALAGSSTSPFGTVGASKPSVFGGASASTTSGFGALAGPKAPLNTTTSGFGSLAADKPSTGFGGFGGAGASGFGGALGTKIVFGPALGNGFGGGSGLKLSSFAATGKENIQSPAKPVKAFGAPDSDSEDASDGEDGSDDGDGADEEDGEKHNSEEKKKFKTAKVHVDDGEAGEATLLQLRAKLYAVESKETGWKERGVGTLKVNVNKNCVEISESGLPLPETVDFSSLTDDDKVPAARLIMRQENTHRVILNTIIVPAMEFQEKPSTTSAQILFTAIEGETKPKPVNMLLKLSEANARLFNSEIQTIQYGLKDLS